MATVAEVQQLINEHQTKLEQIQSQFDELARQIAAAELNAGKNSEELREQEFNLRHDIRSEEQTLQYLEQLLIATKRDAALQQYRQFLEQHSEGANKRRALKAQIDNLKAQLRPLEKEYEVSYQPVNWLGGRINDLRRHLVKEYGIAVEQLDTIKNEVAQAKIEASN